MNSSHSYPNGVESSLPPDKVVAAASLQFLPIPLIVLSSKKTIVLANQMMGKFIGCGRSLDERTTTDYFYGKSLSEIGVDRLENGNPTWTNWEAFLDSVEYSARRRVERSGEYPAACRNTSHNNVGVDECSVYEIPNGATVDVVLSAQCTGKEIPTEYRSRVVQIDAKMTVTVWQLNCEINYTVTFAAAAADGRLFAEECCQKQSVLYRLGPKAPAPQRFSSTSSTVNPFPVMLLDELHSPRKEVIPGTLALTVLQKVTIMKDALLNLAEDPVFMMWIDGSISVPNRAGLRLFEDCMKRKPAQQGADITTNFRMWTENFEKELDKDEFPMTKLCQTKRPLEVKVGMKDLQGNKIIFDISGKGIHDENTGQFVAGIISFSDVTEIQKLENQRAVGERRFKTICSTMLIWTTRPDGYADYFSERCFEFTGATNEELQGHDDLAIVLPKWEKSLRTGREFKAEYRLRRRDGTWRYLLGRAVPLRNPETNQILKWYGSCTDIDEVVQTRIEARQARERLSDVMNHATISLWSIDIFGSITFAEGNIIPWGTSDNATLIGRSIYDVVSEEDVPEFLAPIDMILNNKLPFKFSECFWNGRWLRTKYVPIFESKGTGSNYNHEPVIGMVGVSVDITDKMNTMQELETRERENRILMANERAAKEASKLKSKFLASMSHEIRTPIAGVLGMAYLLHDTSLTDKQREFVENVQRSANSLLTVINDILDFSKVESGMLEVEKVPFNLAVVVDDVIKMLAFDAEKKELKFEHDIRITSTSGGGNRSRDKIKVMGDPGRVRQILTNLITNSIKFTHEGFVMLTVEKVTENDDMMTIKFVVKDTGIGIEKKEQTRLFQPFTQADSSTARKFGGTGLGLSISKNLVDLMGGSIGLSSSIGEGTMAWFTIPFDKLTVHGSGYTSIDNLPSRLQSDPSITFQEESSSWPSAMVEKPSNCNEVHRSSNRENLYNILPVEERKKFHILVVEDNKINQQIALKLIKKFHFSVSAVSDGLEAVKYLEEAFFSQEASSHNKGARGGEEKGQLLAKNIQETKKSKARPKAPDIILMDVHMPEMDGYRATQIIRSGKLGRMTSPTCSSTCSSLTPLCPSPHTQAGGDRKNDKTSSFSPPSSSPSTSTPTLPIAMNNEPFSQPATKQNNDFSVWYPNVPIVALTASAIRGDSEKCRQAGMNDYLAKPVSSRTLERMLVKWAGHLRKGKIVAGEMRRLAGSEGSETREEDEGGFTEISAQRGPS